MNNRIGINVKIFFGAVILILPILVMGLFSWNCIGEIEKSVNDKSAVTETTQKSEKVETEAVDLVSYRGKMLGSYVFALVCMVLGFGYFIIIQRSLSKKLGVIKEAFAEIEKGKLTINISRNSSVPDEIDEVIEGLNSMANMLAKTIGDVLVTYSGIQSTMDKTSKSAVASNGSLSMMESMLQTANQGIEVQLLKTQRVNENMGKLATIILAVVGANQEQQRNSQKSVSSVLEIANAIQSVTVDVELISSSSSEVKKTAEEGNSAVIDAVNEIKKIALEVSESAKSIRNLGTKSEQIGNIVSVIDDIASQTNLLALNAAIEAARAGEHGKGFAVVADEVRKLAERSTEATKEIATLINEIQKDTQGSVESMEKVNGEVIKGVTLAETAGRLMGEINIAISKTETKIQNISASMEEVMASSVEVKGAMESVLSVSQKSAKSADEMSSSSEETKDLINEIGYIAEDNVQSNKMVMDQFQKIKANVGVLVRGETDNQALIDKNIDGLKKKFVI